MFSKVSGVLLPGALLAVCAILGPSADGGELGGQHSQISGSVTLNSSNTWQTLTLGSTPLNTPGGTPNEAWDDGLYLISGTLSHPGANNHVVTRLTVNGTPVTTSIQGNTAYGGNRLYHVGQLNTGDAVAFQYRTPAGGVTINPGGADWQNGTLNIFGGDNLANAQRSELTVNTPLSSSNTWAPLNLTNTLNTPGSTVNEIWSDGLYIIKGHITGPAANNHVVSRLTINGTPVEGSIQGNTTYGTNALSHVGQFTTGDTVALEYRTPGNVSLNPASDWNSASLSLVEVQAADAQRSELGAPVVLNSSNQWTQLNLTNTTLNTPGTTPHEAWEDGLYLITASLSGPQGSGGNSHVVTRLLINGLPVEQSLQGNTLYGTNMLEHLADLEAGDLVSFEYRTPQAGLTIDQAVDWQGASLSLVQFQAQVPEPTSIAIWTLIGLGLVGFGYARRRRK